MTGHHFIPQLHRIDEAGNRHRTWLVTDDAPPPPALLAQHPDVVAARVAPDALAAWGRGGDRIYVVDPLGNLVLAFPREPDVKAMARDLTRLLKASRIG